MKAIWPDRSAIFSVAEPLIMRFENFRAEPYLCPAGKPTIGYSLPKLSVLTIQRVTKGRQMATEPWLLLLAFPLATSLWRALGLSWRLSFFITIIAYLAVALFATCLTLFL